MEGEEAAASGHKARGISLTSRPAAAGRSSGAPTRGQRRAERRRVPTEASPPDVGRRQAAADEPLEALLGASLSLARIKLSGRPATAPK